MSTSTKPAPSPTPEAGPERNDRIRLVAVLVAIGGVLLLAITAVALLRGDDDDAATDGGSDAADGSDWGGTLVDPATPRPDFTLTDTEGRPYAFGDETAGHLTLLFFGYTHCPDVCPVQMAVVSSALEKPEVPAATVVFVTTDPERDNPEQLRHWLDQFPGGEHFVGLRGTQAEVAAAESAAQVAGSVQLPPDDGDTPGDYEVGHAAQIMAYTPDDKAHLAYPFGVRSEDWIADLPRMMSEWGDDAPAGGAALSAGDAFTAAADDVGAVYVTIDNPGDDDTLVGARSSAAGKVTLMSGEAGGAMEETDTVAVPTGTTRFEAGGAHIMLEQLDGALEAGDTVPLELQFEKAGTVTVDVEVLGWDAMVERIEGGEGSAATADGPDEGSAP
jgi:protein SCO1/2